MEQTDVLFHFDPKEKVNIINCLDYHIIHVSQKDKKSFTHILNTKRVKLDTIEYVLGIQKLGIGHYFLSHDYIYVIDMGDNIMGIIQKFNGKVVINMYLNNIKLKVDEFILPTGFYKTGISLYENFCIINNCIVYDYKNFKQNVITNGKVLYYGNKNSFNDKIYFAHNDKISWYDMDLKFVKSLLFKNNIDVEIVRFEDEKIYYIDVKHSDTDKHSIYKLI